MKKSPKTVIDKGNNALYDSNVIKKIYGLENKNDQIDDHPEGNEYQKKPFLLWEGRKNESTVEK